MKKFLVFLLLSASQCLGSTDNQILPDLTRTPGAIDPTMTKEMICAKGFTTKKIRPPAWYTNKLKKQQMKEWEISGSPKDFEEDHLISLELGGSPTDPNNLWPEAYLPKPGAHEKDIVENWLHKQVCSGKIPLSKAQDMIRTDWYAVYKQIKHIR